MSHPTLGIPPPRPDDLKALDRARMQITLLRNNIQSLQHRIATGNPLPPWSSIQTTTAIIGGTLSKLVEDGAKQSEQLNTTVVFPFTDYPGRTQEDLLTQLIRKKPDLAVESWIDEGRAIEAEVTSDTQEDPEKFWKWAVEWVEDRLDTYVRQESQVLYTEEEIAMGIENVRTGLRHSLDSDGSDEEDEDDEMEDVEINITEVTSRAGGVEFGMGKNKQSTESPGKLAKEILKFSTGANGVGLGIDFATL